MKPRKTTFTKFRQTPADPLVSFSSLILLSQSRWLDKTAKRYGLAQAKLLRLILARAMERHA